MKALVCIPTYNEIENLPKIIPEILKRDERLSVLVIDDNSPDGTGRWAEDQSGLNPRVHVLHRQQKLGLGQAYLAGFRWALARDYELIFEMDADFSHNPAYLPDFLAAADQVDLVIGSRYITGVNVINWPMGRLLLSYYANVYSRIVTGLPLRDATGGFKCYHRRVLETIDLDAVRSNGYSFQIEMSFRVWRKGFTIKEIPIVFVDREQGTSKMSNEIVHEAIWMVWRLRLARLFGRL